MLAVPSPTPYLYSFGFTFVACVAGSTFSTFLEAPTHDQRESPLFREETHIDDAAPCSFVFVHLGSQLCTYI